MAMDGKSHGGRPTWILLGIVAFLEEWNLRIVLSREGWPAGELAGQEIGLGHGTSHGGKVLTWILVGMGGQSSDESVWPIHYHRRSPRRC